MGAQSDIERARRAIQDLQRGISQESAKVATARQGASRAIQAAQRSKSEATVASKQREAQREEERAIQAETRRAKLEAKLAVEQRKLHAAEAQRSREQARASEAAMSRMRAAIELSNQQFKPPSGPTSAAMGRVPSTGLSDPPAPAYDVFVSHASEDKAEIATPLAMALRDAGLRVWFDAFELQVGDSLRRKIDEGLSRSTFGVVILSPNFFSKEWPRMELDGLTARAVDAEGPMILPIWHHISKSEVVAQSPTLAGVMALNTAVMTLEEIVEALVRRVGPLG